MSAKNKYCQSCGMPMNRDPQGGGTNADSTSTDLYGWHAGRIDAALL